MIENFSLFEFNRWDKKFLLEEVDDLFTVGIEFELETTHKDVPFRYTSEISNKILEELEEALKRDDIIITPRTIKYVEWLISGFVSVYHGDIEDEESIYDMNEEKLKKIYKLTPEQSETIKEYVLGVLYRLEDEDKIDDFKDLTAFKIKETVGILNEYFPNFIKKWGGKIEEMEDAPDGKHEETKKIGDLKFMIDTSLRKGIEMANVSYVNSLSESIEMVEDFFKEYNEQNAWKFNYNTGLHINIGVKDKNVKWNIIKGIVMISDFNDKKTPFVYIDQEERKDTAFANSVIDTLKRDLDVDLELDFKEEKDVEKIEKELNSLLNELLEERGQKYFGLNLYKIINYGYNEFRYLGGENLSENLIKEKLVYFAYITYLMYDEDFKKWDYYKKLYKVLDYLKI